MTSMFQTNTAETAGIFFKPQLFEVNKGLCLTSTKTISILLGFIRISPECVPCWIIRLPPSVKVFLHFWHLQDISPGSILYILHMMESANTEAFHSPGTHGVSPHAGSLMRLNITPWVRWGEALFTFLALTGLIPCGYSHRDWVNHCDWRSFYTFGTYRASLLCGFCNCIYGGFWLWSSFHTAGIYRISPLWVQGVGSVMVYKCDTVTEALPTQLRFIVFPPCVDSVMEYKVAVDTEALCTLLTLNRFFPVWSSLLAPCCEDWVFVPIRLQTNAVKIRKEMQ